MNMEDGDGQSMEWPVYVSLPVSPSARNTSRLLVSWLTASTKSLYTRMSRGVSPRVGDLHELQARVRQDLVDGDAVAEARGRVHELAVRRDVDVGRQRGRARVVLGYSRDDLQRLRAQLTGLGV